MAAAGNDRGEPSIEQLKRELAALRAAQQAQAQGLTCPGMVALTLDASGRVVSCAGGLRGLVDAVEVGADWLERHVPEEEREGQRRRWRRLLAGLGGGLWTGAAVGPAERRWEIQWHEQLLRDEQGEVAGVSRVGVDVTEQQLAMASLAHQAEQMLGAFHYAATMLAVIDARGQLVLANAQWESFAREHGAASLIRGSVGENYLSLLHEAGLSGSEETEQGLRDLLAGRQERYVIQHNSPIDDREASFVMSAAPLAGGMSGVVICQQDVTDRKEAERRVEDSESRFRTVFDRVALGIILADPEGRAIRANPAATGMLGYSEPELVGLTFAKLTSPEDLPVSFQMFQEMHAGQRDSYELEKRLIHKDGSSVWAHVIASTVRDELGRMRYLIAMIKDITAQKLAEQALKESEARYRGLIESQTDMVVRVDIQGRFTFVNDAYCRTFGKSSEELMGRNFAPLVHPEDLPDTLTAMERLKYPPYRATMEQRAMTEHGWRWIVWEDYAIRDDAGQIVEIQAVGRDITDRKEAEQALRRSEERYRGLVECQQDIILRFDARGRFTFVNDAYCRMFGRRREEVIGRPMEAVLSIHALPHGRRVLEQLRQGLERVGVELRAETEMGPRWFAWEVYGIRDEEEQLIETQAVGRDVTEQREAEQKMREHQQELAHVGRLATMGELAAGIAHELNQPLAAVANYCHGSLRRLQQKAEQADPELVEAMTRAAAQAERAGRILHRVKHFIQHKQLEVTEVVVGEMIDEAVEMMEWEIRRAGVRLVRKVQADLPTVLADRVQIEQVLVNLIKNGLEAMEGLPPQRMRVEVAARLVNSGKVRLTVHDSGEGMSDEQLKHIFQPFVTSKPRGMGMGLTISQSIVEAHGGELWVESSPAQGAWFHFTVPVSGGD